MESGDLLGNVCGGRGKCSFCGEMHNNVAYHEAWQCEKNKHSLKSPVTSVASRKSAPIAVTETLRTGSLEGTQRMTAPVEPCEFCDIDGYGQHAARCPVQLERSLAAKDARIDRMIDAMQQTDRDLAATRQRCAELEKWHVSNWTCTHHSDKEREDNKPCCPVCARRELVELRQRCEELDSDLEIIRRNIAGGAVSVMWVQKFIEDRRADRAKQALTQQEPRT